MQNQILGFFIITCVSLGVLCGVQWKQLREKRQEISELSQSVADQTVALDGQGSTVEALKREQSRLSQELRQRNEQIVSLRETNDWLTRQGLPQRLAGPSSEEGDGNLFQDSLSRLLERGLAQPENGPPVYQQELLSRLCRVIGEERSHLTQTNTWTDPARPPASEPLATGPEQQLRQQEELNRRVLERGKEFLLPDQLRILAEFQTHQIQMRKAGLELMQSMRQPD